MGGASALAMSAAVAGFNLAVSPVAVGVTGAAVVAAVTASPTPAKADQTNTCAIFTAGGGISSQGANAVGNDAFACGPNAQAIGSGATAIGTSAQALGSDTTAVGRSALANSSNATALGADAQATSVNSTAIGQSAAATSTNATAVGQDF